MYKALDQSIRDSEKLAKLSDFAFRVWTYGLAAADMVGRITANPVVFHAKAFPLLPFDKEKIIAAFTEFDAAKLCHFYKDDDRNYLVFHDHDEFNRGSRNLRNPPKSKVPPPPPSLCYCITFQKHEEEGGTAVSTAVNTAAVPVPVLVPVPVPEGMQGEPNPTSPESRLVLVAEQQRVIAKPDTMRRYITGWISDRGFQYAESSLMDPWTRGKDILSVHDRFFRVNGNGKHQKVPEKPKKARADCDKCRGSGRRPNPATGGHMDCGCLR